MRGAVRPLRERDAGFGIVEVLVAMTIMAIVLMTLAPFLVSSFKTTARNVRIAAATELVNARIATAQSQQFVGSCDAFADFQNTTGGPSTVVDQKRNITYQVKVATDFDSSASCRAAVNTKSAKSYYVRVEVSDLKDGVILASAKTWIAVPGFGS